MNKKLFIIFISLILSSAAFAQDDIDLMVSKMTLRQKLGQMIMPDIRHWIVKGRRVPFQTINPEVKNFIAEYQFGGIILFADNISSIEQIVRLNHDLQKAVIDKGAAPLFISIDQEGGFVSRLPFKPRLTGAMALGAANDEKLSYEYGRILALELKALGINLNFAPVLDINNNPNNPVIGLRSISSHPKIVSRHGLAILRGMQDNQMAAVAKHFPGHGNTSVDSHIGMPIVDKSMTRLKDFELLPFKDASPEADMIMTAHIALIKIDPSLKISKKGSVINTPATISPVILSGLLRGILNYEGIIITDSMSMAAIASNFDQVYAVIEAFKAGADIALMPAHIESLKNKKVFDRLFDGLEKAVRQAELDEKKIDASVRRILSLKKKRGILESALYKIPIDEKIRQAREVFSSKEIADIEKETALKAITVLKDKDKILPLKLKNGDRVLFLGENLRDEETMKAAAKEMTDKGILSGEIVFESASYLPDASGLKDKIEAYDYVIVVSKIFAFNEGESDGRIEIIRDLLEGKKERKKLIIISAALPYDAAYYENARTIVLCYGSPKPTNNSAMSALPDMPNLSAALSIILNPQIRPQGLLPVDIYKIDKKTGVFSRKILFKAGVK